MRKKLLSLLLCIVLCLSLMPTTAFAYDDEDYEDLIMTVGGHDVTRSNANDILGDGGSVSFDWGSKVLTLVNATIKNDNSAIVCHNPLKIVVNGTNTIESSDYFGIYGWGIDITGDGSLKINAPEIGIESETEINITGNVSLDITAEDGDGINTYQGGVTVNTTGGLNIRSGNCGIHASGYVVLGCSGNVDIYGKSCGIELLRGIDCDGEPIDPKVYLNGTSDFITIRSGGKAVECDSDYDACIVDYYDKYTVTGSPNSTSVVFALNGNPLAITAQPVNVTVTEGSTAKFTVAASGTGLKYQWQYKTANGTSWKNSSSATKGYNEATLEVEATTARNGYSYRCIVTDAKSNTVTSDEVKLTVNVPLVITKQPVSVTANAGDMVNFSVTATGTGLTYQWQCLSARASRPSWTNLTARTTGADTPTVRVRAVESASGNKYRCIITDATGETVTSNAAALIVTPSLAITTQPVNVTVTEGSTASFNVDAKGTGLTYQWQYKTANGTSWKNSSSATKGYNEATLEVEATAARNGYSYRCIVTDASGKTVTSDEAVLTVKTAAALAITTQPANATVTEGSTASFKVVATGTGLKYQWQYKTASATTWKDCTSTTTGYNTATLKPVGTAARNGYQYRCVITDASGNKVTSNAAKLTVNSASSLAITTQPANATVTEGSSASFKVVATGTSLKYQWQYKSASATTWKDCTSTTTGYNTATLKPVGTAARNGYQYRCVITDASGNKVTSNAAKLTVKSASSLAITTQPANATVNEGSSASFKVVATGTGLSYQWQFSKSGTEWKDCTSTTAGYNTATLKPVGTAARNGYSYRCIITDANGNSVTSNAAKLTVK